MIRATGASVGAETTSEVATAMRRETTAEEEEEEEGAAAVAAVIGDTAEETETGTETETETGPALTPETETGMRRSLHRASCSDLRMCSLVWKCSWGWRRRVMFLYFQQ
jgi:hypothetical protein